jgi:hypothetical protein
MRRWTMTKAVIEAPRTGGLYSEGRYRGQFTAVPAIPALAPSRASCRAIRVLGWVGAAVLIVLVAGFFALGTLAAFIGLPA